MYRIVTQNRIKCAISGAKFEFFFWGGAQTPLNKITT